MPYEGPMKEVVVPLATGASLLEYTAEINAMDQRI